MSPTSGRPRSESTEGGDAERAFRSRPQTPVERWAERGLILFGKAVVATLLAATLYGFLTFSFLVCCGLDLELWKWAPTRSPFGLAVTVLLVWPATGLLCLLLEDAPGEVVRALGSGIARLAAFVRSRR